MATLTITELKSLGRDAQGNDVMAPEAPAENEQHLDISASPNSSAAFGATTRFVMLNCDTACCLGWGVDAVDKKHRMGANETRFYTVKPGATVSVIQSST